MEVCSKPGMAGDGSRDLQNTVIKNQIAALGFRVKSGWAAVVLLTDTADSPQLSGIGCVTLCDPRRPETRQPYHAAMGRLETDSTKVKQREHIVRNVSRQSLTKLLRCYQKKEILINRAAVVVGSRTDPISIANPHIRAHALEGRLFRSVLEQSLQEHGIRTELLLERDAYATVAARLNQSSNELKRAILNLGRSAAAMEEAWRAEQKLAALAALFVL
jgi:hypothetical protein